MGVQLPGLLFQQSTKLTPTGTSLPFDQKRASSGKQRSISPPRTYLGTHINHVKNRLSKVGGSRNRAYKEQRNIHRIEACQLSILTVRRAHFWSLVSQESHLVNPSDLPCPRIGHPRVLGSNAETPAEEKRGQKNEGVKTAVISCCSSERWKIWDRDG